MAPGYPVTPGARPATTKHKPTPSHGHGLHSWVHVPPVAVAVQTVAGPPRLGYATWHGSRPSAEGEPTTSTPIGPRQGSREASATSCVKTKRAVVWVMRTTILATSC